MILNLLLLLMPFLNYVRGECEQQYCPSNTTQVGCITLEEKFVPSDTAPYERIKQAKFSEACGPGKHKYLKIDGELREIILDELNYFRNVLAIPPAHMPVVRWDKKLSNAAMVLVHMCDTKGKICSNMKQYNYVSTIEVTGSFLESNSTDYAEMLMDNYMGEQYICECITDYNDPDNEPNPCLKDLLPVIQDRGNRVGCALRSTPVEYRVRATLICILSRGSVNGLPPFTVGKIAGEGCKTGHALGYSTLCSEKEIVDPNSMVINYPMPNKKMKLRGTCKKKP